MARKSEGKIEFRIARPVDEVFACVGDPERGPEWLPDLLSIEKVTPGEVGVGTRYRAQVKLAKKHAQAEMEVTEYEPGRVIAQRGTSGPSTFFGRFTLRPDGDETLITHEYSFQLAGVLRFLGPVVSGLMQSNVEAGIAGLRRTLEQR